MNCDDLAATGLAHSLLALALLCAGACLIVGLLLLTRGRRGSGVAIIAVLLLCAGAGVGLGAAPAAHAVPSACADPVPAADNSLTIAQTSTMTGLAPGVLPVAIAGTVTNNGGDDTFITAIVVSIDSVIVDPDAAAGTCDASDYVLLDPRMPVGETLDPGGSTGFGGASIGFSDKSTNQDACQGATVNLLYRTD